MNRNLCGWPGGRPQYEGCELKRSCAAALLVFLAAAARTGFVPARLRRCRPDLGGGGWVQFGVWCSVGCVLRSVLPKADRKSTRLNSSHGYISYAVFCLKKKNTIYA